MGPVRPLAPARARGREPTRVLDPLRPGAFVAVVYTAAEIADYDFGLATGAVLAACVAALVLALARFRRVDLPRQPPEAIAVPLRFVGTWSLEIYAGTLFLGFVTAG